jgi:putative MFS transporter
MLGAIPLVLAVVAVLAFGVEPAKGSVDAPAEPSAAT